MRWLFALVLVVAAPASLAQTFPFERVYSDQGEASIGCQTEIARIQAIHPNYNPSYSGTQSGWVRAFRCDHHAANRRYVAMAEAYSSAAGWEWGQLSQGGGRCPQASNGCTSWHSYPANTQCSNRADEWHPSPPVDGANTSCDRGCLYRAFLCIDIGGDSDCQSNYQYVPTGGTCSIGTPADDFPVTPPRDPDDVQVPPVDPLDPNNPVAPGDGNATNEVLAPRLDAIKAAIDQHQALTTQTNALIQGQTQQLTNAIHSASRQNAQAIVFGLMDAFDGGGPGGGDPGEPGEPGEGDSECDAVGCTQGEDHGIGDEGDPDSLFSEGDGETPLFDRLDTQGLGWSRSCPGLPSVSFYGHELMPDNDNICGILSFLAALILAAAYVHAAYIVGRG